MTFLRVVRGTPDEVELAALAAIVSAAGAAPAPAVAEAPRQRGRWADPAHAHRRLWPVGPGGWRAGAH